MNNKKLASHAQFFKPETDLDNKRLILRDTIKVDDLDDDKLREISQDLDDEYQQLMKDRDVLRSDIIPSASSEIYLPVNVERLIWNIKEKQ